MSKRITKAAIIFIISVLILYFYTFLHEGGHALTGLISHGSVEKMTLGLNARVYISGARFTPFTEALNHLSGLLLPVIFLLISIIFYNRNFWNSIYHISYSLLFFFVLGSLLAWIFFPLISLFAAIPAGDDISKFLSVSGVHPILLSFASIALSVILLKIGQKKGIFFKIREMMTEFRSERLSGNTNIFFRKSILAVLLGLILFVVFIFLEKQKSVFRTSFSMEVSSLANDMKFPFEIAKSSVYRMDLNLKAKGILVDTQLYNETGQMIYHVIGEQVTLQKPIDLIKGKYFCLLTFMTEAIEMKEHIKVKGYPLEEERIRSLEKIFNYKSDKSLVNFSATIR